MNSASRRFQAPSYLKSDHSLKLQSRSDVVSELSIVGDVSTGQFYPLVSLIFRDNIFNLYHGLSHSGICTTLKLIGQRFVWPSMKLYIAQHYRKCVAC